MVDLLPYFKSVLFLRGYLPQIARLESLKALPWVAADGAYEGLRELGFLPQLVVGDEDSLKASKNPVVEFIQDPDQETNDFEKCLGVMEARGFFPALICGMSGGDIDHIHNNLTCFMKYAQKLPMVFLDTPPASNSKLGFCVQKNLHLEFSGVSAVSLLGYPRAVVRTQGLVWPLYQEPLELLGRSGALNKSQDKQVIVTVSQGSLLAVVDEGNCLFFDAGF